MTGKQVLFNFVDDMKGRLEDETVTGKTLLDVGVKVVEQQSLERRERAKSESAERRERIKADSLDLREEIKSHTGMTVALIKKGIVPKDVMDTHTTIEALYQKLDGKTLPPLHDDDETGDEDNE